MGTSKTLGRGYEGGRRKIDVLEVPKIIEKVPVVGAFSVFTGEKR